MRLLITSKLKQHELTSLWHCHLPDFNDQKAIYAHKVSSPQVTFTLHPSKTYLASDVKVKLCPKKGFLLARSALTRIRSEHYIDSVISVYEQRQND